MDLKEEKLRFVQGVPSELRPGLSWLWFLCSTILPSCQAAYAKFSSAQADSGRHWNTQNSSQQNPVSAHLGHPVDVPTTCKNVCSALSVGRSTCAAPRTRCTRVRRSCWPSTSAQSTPSTRPSSSSRGTTYPCTRTSTGKDGGMEELFVQGDHFGLGQTLYSNLRLQWHFFDNFKLLYHLN